MYVLRKLLLVAIIACVVLVTTAPAEEATMQVAESRRQPNRFARQLFDGLPGRYDRLAEVLSMGQNGRWRRAMSGCSVSPLGGRGASSRPSSRRMTTCCHPTTFKKTPRQW